LAILVILVLGILWAAVLIPPILRARTEGAASTAGVGDFLGRLRSGLGHGSLRDSAGYQPIMGPIQPMDPIGQGVGMGPVQIPGGMSPVQRRRRDILVGLLAAVGVTFFMALMGASVIFWMLHLVVDLALGGYVVVLLQIKSRNAERRAKVRPIAPPAYGPVGASNVTPFVRRGQAVNERARVEVPREATVLALRRTASW
jgi:hypothetical protein